MEIRFKRKDIIDSIIIYYKKYKGMDVEVLNNPEEENVDEAFKVVYRFNEPDGEKIIVPLPIGEISGILRKLLVDAGLDVISVFRDYGGYNKKESNGTTYMPRLSKIIVECGFKNIIDKEKDNVRTI